MMYDYRLVTNQCVSGNPLCERVQIASETDFEVVLSASSDRTMILGEIAK